MDRGAWQATVHGVAKSGIRLKQLSMHMAHFFLASNLGKVHSQHTVASQSFMSSIKESKSESRLVATPWTAQSMELGRPEYWSW